MKHRGTYLLLPVTLVGCLGSPFLPLNQSDGANKQLVKIADPIPVALSQPQSVSPVRGVVARSYEEREASRQTDQSRQRHPAQTQSAGQCKITPHQQQMLRLVNRARARQRNCGGEMFRIAPALKWNCRLHKAAIAHSQDMIDYDFFDHQGSDGSSVGMRVSRSGYEWRAVGENIAAGYPDNETVMENLLSSPTHCENIMDPKFREFGSAVITTDQAHYDNYWTQVFAAR
jgi:uncharacterized protein YkwD